MKPEHAKQVILDGEGFGEAVQRSNGDLTGRPGEGWTANSASYCEESSSLGEGLRQAGGGGRGGGGKRGDQRQKARDRDRRKVTSDKGVCE